LQELADILSDRYETKVRVDMGRNKGKIIVEFATLEDLDRIIKSMAPDQDDPPGPCTISPPRAPRPTRPGRSLISTPELPHRTHNKRKTPPKPPIGRPPSPPGRHTPHPGRSRRVMPSPSELPRAGRSPRGAR